jgi:hypothetical protein
MFHAAACCCCCQALEKYLMTKLHERTSRQAPDDMERDELLAVRCAACHAHILICSC